MSKAKDIRKAVEDELNLTVPGTVEASAHNGNITLTGSGDTSGNTVTLNGPGRRVSRPVP